MDYKNVVWREKNEEGTWDNLVDGNLDFVDADWPEIYGRADFKNHILEDSNGNYYTEIEIILTNEFENPLTGKIYNILPFAIVIVIATAGIILMKKTSTRKGGARYEE